MIGIPEGKAREKGVQAIFETIMTDNYSKHQTTLPGSLETTRKINAGEKKKKTPHLDTLFSNYRKQKNLKNPKGKKLGRKYLPLS